MIYGHIGEMGWITTTYQGRRLHNASILYLPMYVCTIMYYVCLCLPVNSHQEKRWKLGESAFSHTIYLILCFTILYGNTDSIVDCTPFTAGHYILYHTYHVNLIVDSIWCEKAYRIMARVTQNTTNQGLFENSHEP